MDILEKVKDYQVEPVKKIMAQARNAKEKGTVFFGDSIIQNFPIQEYFPSDHMYNCGCNGATSYLLLHLQPYAVRDYHPSRVVLMIGTNDLDDEWQFDRLEIAFNVYKLMNIMRNQNPNVQIIVISPLPIVESSMKRECRDNTQLRVLGDEIRANVEEYHNAFYINMFPFFVDENGQLKQEYTSDGLHLSKEGYDVFASLLQEYLL